jgi:hypothetical protein
MPLDWDAWVLDISVRLSDEVLGVRTDVDAKEASNPNNHHGQVA